MVPSTKDTKELLSSFKADVKGKFSYAKRSEIKDNKLGMVYCFGGKNSRHTFTHESYKYDISQNKWIEIAKAPSKLYSFNLVPCWDRYILFVARGVDDNKDYHDVYDYINDKWIAAYKDPSFPINHAL